MKSITLILIALIASSLTQAATAKNVECSSGLTELTLLEGGVLKFSGLKYWSNIPVSFELKCDGVSGGGEDWFDSYKHICRSSDGAIYYLYTERERTYNNYIIRFNPLLGHNDAYRSTCVFR